MFELGNTCVHVQQILESVYFANLIWISVHYYDKD